MGAIMRPDDFMILLAWMRWGCLALVIVFVFRILKYPYLLHDIFEALR
jgi:hypothetical protein